MSQFFQTPFSDRNPRTIAIVGRNFGVGVSLSGIPVLAYLWLSVDMTYGSWAAVEPKLLIGAIAIPVLGGGVTAIVGQRAIRWLSQILESVQLPF